jgi:hypothetical protein
MKTVDSRAAAALARRRAALERRLNEGFQRIDAAAADGKDVATWETFWVNLLAEYEAVCDELGQAA